MDILTASLDLLLLLVAIAYFPTAQYYTTHPPGADHVRPRSPLQVHSSPYSTPGTSPLASPIALPVITVTPEYKRPSHKRKNVSFSLTSISDLEPEHGAHKPKRPPTPYVSGPVSPRDGQGGDLSDPATPMMVNRAVVDSMGVQKGWLMP